MCKRLIAAQQFVQTEASAAAAITLFAPAVLFDDDRDIEAHQGPDIRRQVPSLVAIRITSCTAANDAMTCLTRGSMRRVSASMRINHATLSSSRTASSGSTGRYNRWVRGRCHAFTALRPPLRAMARAASDASINAGSSTSSVAGEAGLLAADGAHADPLFDAVRSLFDDPVFQRPGFLPRQLKIQVGVIDTAAHDGVEHRRQSILIETRGRQNHSFGYIEHGCTQFRTACIHVSTAAMSGNPSCRLASAGKRARVSASLARSISALITPLPFARRDNT